ncbi:MAG: translation initiation factor IF-2 N-terminal domain-containing protein [bacterium]
MAKIKISALADRLSMDPKAVIAKLAEAGIQAKRRDSSVDETAALAALGTAPAPAPAEQGAEVVSLDQAREKKASKPKKEKTPKKPKSDSDDWYKKYPWVVKGSVREPTSADRKALGSRCHGKVCTVRCVDSGVERVVNTQDAFQSKRCPDAQKAYMRRRRAERRQARKDAKAAKKANHS